MHFYNVLNEVTECGQTEDGSSAEVDATMPRPRQLQSTKAYLNRLGASALPAPYFVNGAAMPRNDAWLQAMSQRIDADLRTLQRQVYEAVIPEDTWLAGQFLDSASTHRNPLIVPEDEDNIKVVDLGSIFEEHRTIYEELPRIDPIPSIIGLERFAPSILVVADLCSAEGTALSYEALKFQESSGDVEVIFVHNPSAPKSCTMATSLISSKGDVNHGIPAADIRSWLAENTSVNHSAQNNVDESNRFWQNCRSIIKAFGLDPAQQALLANGRVVGPFDASTPFDAQDFDLLLQYERSKRIAPAEKVLTGLGFHDRLKTPTDSAILSSTIALSAISDIPEGIFDSAPTLRMDTFARWAGNYTMIQTGDPSSSSIHLVASIDPTSQVAQRCIHILKVL